ncbi:MLST8 family protein [Megaselia abdita]
MIAACGYQCLRLYDIVNCTNPIINYEGIQKNITRLGFPEDGTWMFTGGEDCKVRIWDMLSQQQIRSFDCNSPINSVCLHPNQVEIAIASQSGGVFLWNVNNKEHEHLVPDQNASVQDVAISPDGKFMAAVNNRGRCYIWDLKCSSDQKLISEPKAKKMIAAHVRYALRVKFSPNSKFMVTTSFDGTAKIWEVPKFELVKELKKPNSQWVWDAAFSLDSKYLFTASSDGLCRLWNWKSQSIVREYSGHTKAITALSFRDEIICEN